MNKSSLKLFENLKERINQLRLDQDAKSGLNERISELRESNAALTASGNARELEIQAMTKRINEMGRELSDCRDQLAAKSDELAALRALPKEDPVFVGKMRDLENAKTILEGQINTVNQETSKAKEELVSCRETILNAQEQSQEFQGKLTEARTTIKTLLEDKKKCLATYKAEVEKACDKVANAAYAAKMEVKLQHDCRVKNVEQRRSEAERELALAQEKLHKSQEERTSYTTDLNKFQEDLSACKKQIAQQSAYIKRADRLLPARDLFDCRQGELQQVIARMIELKAHFEDVQKETSKQIGDAVIKYQSETASLIKRVDALEKESSMPDQAPHQMGPPGAIIPKFFAAQRPSSAASNLYSSQAGTNDDRSFSHDMPGTPKDASRQNELRISSAIQRSSSSNISHATPTETHYANPDVTPSGVQWLQVASTMMRTNPVVAKLATESPSPYQGTPKPLRPANRKSRGLAQSVQEEESMTTIEIHSVKVSSLGQTNARSPPTQPRKDMVMSSSGLSRMSSGRISSTIIQPPRGEKPVDTSYDNTAGHEEHSIVTQTPTDETPFKGAPQLTSSSPLTDLVLSSIDLVGCEEDDSNKASLETKDSKVGTSTLKKDGGGRTSASTYVSAGDTVAAVKFKEVPTSYQFSDDDDFGGINATRSVKPTMLSATDESVRRRQPKPLKSALKKSSKTQDRSTANMAQTDVYTIPKSTLTDPSLLKTTTRSTTKQAAPARNATSGSSYNRIASGSKSDGSSQASAAPSAVQKLSATRQILSNVEKSPLMPAPQRNSRKRSASQSEPKSLPTKPFKQPRLSLPNQGHRESRTVTPDSQEEHVNYRH